MNTTRNINGRRIEIQARKPRSSRGEDYIGWNVAVNEARYFFSVRTAEDAINKALIQYLDAMEAATVAPTGEPVRDAETRDSKPRRAAPANPLRGGCENLLAAIRDHLSPGAVALLASCLGIARANDPNVEREIFWFRDTMIEKLLGGDEYCRLLDELGL